MEGLCCCFVGHLDLRTFGDHFSKCAAQTAFTLSLKKHDHVGIMLGFD